MREGRGREAHFDLSDLTEWLKRDRIWGAKGHTTILNSKNEHWSSEFECSKISFRCDVVKTVELFLVRLKLRNFLAENVPRAESSIDSLNALILLASNPWTITTCQNLNLYHNNFQLRVLWYLPTTFTHFRWELRTYTYQLCKQLFPKIDGSCECASIEREWMVLCYKFSSMAPRPIEQPACAMLHSMASLINLDLHLDSCCASMPCRWKPTTDK